MAPLLVPIRSGSVRDEICPSRKQHNSQQVGPALAEGGEDSNKNQVIFNTKFELSRSFSRSSDMFKRLSMKIRDNLLPVAPATSPTKKIVPLNLKEGGNAFKGPIRDQLNLLKSNVEKFLRALEEAKLDEDESRDEVGFFLSSVDEKIQSVPVLKQYQFYELAALKQEVENYLFSTLYNKILNDPAEKLVDAAFEKKLELLAWVTPIHLELNEKFYTNDLWADSGNQLASINSFLTPTEKMMCIANAFKVLTFLFNEAGSVGAADDFLPMLIWVILRSGVSHLHFNLKFIEKWVPQEFMSGAMNYYFINVVSACEFIKSANASSLKISEEEWTRKMGLTIGDIPPPRSPLVLKREAPATPQSATPDRTASSPQKTPSTRSHSAKNENVSNSAPNLHYLKNAPTPTLLQRSEPASPRADTSGEETFSRHQKDKSRRKERKDKKEKKETKQNKTALSAETISSSELHSERSDKQSKESPETPRSEEQKKNRAKESLSTSINNPSTSNSPTSNFPTDSTLASNDFTNSSTSNQKAKALGEKKEKKIRSKDKTKKKEKKSKSAEGQQSAESASSTPPDLSTCFDSLDSQTLEKFPYLQKRAESLTVDDLPALLQGYKQLAFRLFLENQTSTPRTSTKGENEADNHQTK